MTTPVAPTAVPAGPAVPNSSDSVAVFDTAYQAFMSWEKNDLEPGINALVVNAYDNAVIAYDEAAAAVISANEASISASNAATSAAAAGAAAGAPVWVSGTFAFGDARWSPINRLVYRYITVGGGAGVTDPSLDVVNWALLGTLSMPVIAVTGTTQTAIKGNDYAAKNAASTTFTGPSSAATGDRWAATVANGRTDNVVNWNGLKHQGISDATMILDAVRTWEFKYIDTTFGWKVD